MALTFKWRARSAIGSTPSCPPERLFVVFQFFESDQLREVNRWSQLPLVQCGGHPTPSHRCFTHLYANLVRNQMSKSKSEQQVRHDKRVEDHSAEITFAGSSASHSKQVIIFISQ
jgi:hypothetical protein